MLRCVFITLELHHFLKFWLTKHCSETFQKLPQLAAMSLGHGILTGHNGKEKHMPAVAASVTGSHKSFAPLLLRSCSQMASAPRRRSFLGVEYLSSEISRVTMQNSLKSVS